MSPSLKGALLGMAEFGLFSLADATINFLGGSYHPVQVAAFAGLFTLPLIGLLWLKRRERCGPCVPG